MTLHETLTGQESPMHGTPEAALSQFYRAFNGGDLSLMETNWFQSHEASMSNPLGGIKRGWPEIRELYERIFTGPAEVYVEYTDYRVFQSGDFFQSVGREQGTFRLGDVEVPLKIRTSRTFLFHEGDYRQLHHHGSIEDPQLLNRYQKAVRGDDL